MSDRDSAEEITAAAGCFATTLWTVVLDCKEGTGSQAREAMAQLCRTYWYPLYAYVRRSGVSEHDAQDLTQEFFARFIGKHYLKSVHQEKGKFRSFLLASLKHFLADEWDRGRALKRGGGAKMISLDDDTAETRYRLEPAYELSAEKIYERRWALILLEQVLSRLEAEFVRDGKAALFNELQVFLQSGRGDGSYREVGERLNMSEGAIKVAVHRMRGRYRELLRAESQQTVATPEEIDGELRHLLAALS
jgi:RNA polymerase sigma factor (sigma-70 family)